MNLLFLLYTFKVWGYSLYVTFFGGDFFVFCVKQRDGTSELLFVGLVCWLFFFFWFFLILYPGRKGKFVF